LSQESIIKPSITAYRLANDAALEELQHERGNESLKQSWIKLADQLEVEGILKHKISTIGKQIIIEKKKEHLEKLHVSQEKLDSLSISGWWYDVMHDQGCTDPHYNRVATATELENSFINTTETKQPNQEMIDIFMDLKEICNLGIDKAKNTKEFEELFDKKETKEFYKQQRAFISNCKDVLDDKTKIPVNTELLFIECVTIAEGGLNNAVKLFHKTRMQLLDDQGKKLITAKQTAKYLNGDKASKLPLLKPNSRDSAIFGKYFGVQCECGSWRVRIKNDGNKVECFDCDLEFIAKTLSKCTYCQTPLYKESLQYIIKTNKCENCNTEIILPQELIQYVNT